MDNILLLIIIIIFGLFLLILLMKDPYLGVAVIIASLPINDLLPQIPYFSSVVPLVGGVTLLGYLLHKRKGAIRNEFNLSRLHVLGLLFIMWMFVSNPEAAWLGTDRNWVFTFIQLWLLMYLSGELLDTEKKQVVVMVIFSVIAIISAFYAIQSGSIGEEFETSIRSEGFVDNPNAAARYFTVAMVFLSYLRSITKRSLLRLFILGGIFITYLGVFYTVSRTGILLMFAAQGLILLLQSKGRQRIGVIVTFVVGLVLLWLFSNSIFGIIESIFPTIINQEDTFGLRINLWKSGLMMWLDHPIRGVGIGMYIRKLYLYIFSLEGIHRTKSVTHNTYIQVLAETGIVGFILFMQMIYNAIKNLWPKNSPRKSSQIALRNAWFIGFVVMLLGGITKSDHADKLSWMVMGVSLYFARQSLPVKEEVKTEEAPVSPSMVVTPQK